MSRYLDAWNDAQMRHAIIVHFPVVLSIVAVVFAVLAAVWCRHDRGRILRWITVGGFAALTLAALMARNTGHDAEEAVEGALDDAGEADLEEHEHDGHNLWLLALGVTALAGASFAARTPIRVTASWLTVVGGLFTAVRVAHVADLGGRLVYEHGAASVAVAISPGAAGGDASSGDPRLAHFRDQVRPLLIEHCLRCHRPSRVHRAGGLDETTIAGMLRGGESGPAIVPGRPDDSLLIKAVRWEDPDLEMPRGGDQLAPEQIAALEQWIRDGAVWEPFTFKIE